MTLADSIRSRVVRLLAEFGLEAVDPEAIVASEIEELHRYVAVFARSKGEQSPPVPTSTETALSSKSV